MNRGVTAFVTLLVVLMLAPAVCLAQSAADKSGARAIAEQGFDAYEANDNEKALDLFTRAEKLYPAPPHKLYMARSLARLGRLVEAKELYMLVKREQLSDSAPEAFRSAQQDAIKELSELEPRVPTLTVTVQGPAAEGAVVTVNGQELDSVFVGVSRPVDPGGYEIGAKSETGAAEPQTVTIAEGANESVSLTVVLGVADPADGEPEPGPEATPEDSSGPNRVPAIVAGTIGIAGVVFGVVSTVGYSSKKSKGDEIFDACDPAVCTDGDRADIKEYDDQAASKGTMAIIGYGVGAAGLTTAVILWVVGSKKAKSSALSSPGSATARTVSPYASFNQLGLTGTF